MSLKTRVEGYVGSITDTDLLTDILTASTKYIMDILPVNLFEQFSSTATVPSGGYGIQAYKLLSASKGGYPARKVDASSKTALSDYNSIYYATTTDPCYYIENGSIYILPSGGTVTVVSYPTVDGSQVFIYGLPQGLDEAVVILSAIKELDFKANGYIDVLNAYSIDLVVTPTTPSSPSFTYTDATLSSYINTVVGSLGVIPTYIKPTISLTSAPSDLTISSSPPTTPVAPSYSYSSASIGIYTSTTIGSLGTTPTYTKPPTTVDWTDFGVAYANDDVELAQVQIAKEGNLLDNYSQDIQNELNEFQRELSIYQSTVQNAIRQAELDQERLMATANKTTDLNIQNEAQTLSAAINLYKDTLQKYSEDLGLYNQTVTKEIQEYRANLEKWQSLRQTELSQYDLDIRNETNEFQKELSIYQSTIQEAIQNAQMAQQLILQKASDTKDLNLQNEAQELARQVQEYQATLTKYQSQIQSYATEVGMAIQKYSTRSVNIIAQHTALLNQMQMLEKQLMLILGKYIGVSDGK